MGLLVYHSPGRCVNNNPGFCGRLTLQQGSWIYGIKSSCTGRVYIQPRVGKHDFAQQKIGHVTFRFNLTFCMVIINKSECNLNIELDALLSLFANRSDSRKSPYKITLVDKIRRTCEFDYLTVFLKSESHSKKVINITHGMDVIGSTCRDEYHNLMQKLDYKEKSVKSRLLNQIRTYCGSQASCEQDFVKLIQNLEKDKFNFF